MVAPLIVMKDPRTRAVFLCDVRTATVTEPRTLPLTSTSPFPRRCIVSVDVSVLVSAITCLSTLRTSVEPPQQPQPEEVDEHNKNNEDDAPKNENNGAQQQEPQHLPSQQWGNLSVLLPNDRRTTSTTTIYLGTGFSDIPTILQIKLNRTLHS